MPSFSIRALISDDALLLPFYLHLAAHEPSIEVAMANPLLARYVEDWGRYGDFGIAAFDAQSGQDIGAVWARLWRKEDVGFGFIDEATPELALAVRPKWQGQGVGTALIETLLARINANRAVPFERVSLNVRAESPAFRLYQRLGFEKVIGSEIINRTGGMSFNMTAKAKSFSP